MAQTATPELLKPTKKQQMAAVRRAALDDDGVWLQLLTTRTSPRPFTDLIKALQAGLPYRAFERFQRDIQLPAKDVAMLLNIPFSTLTRRKENGHLATNESERLVRYARLFVVAVELFEGDSDGARRWLRTPNGALSNLTPLEMARTELGAREVENLINRLENGVFS